MNADPPSTPSPGNAPSWGKLVAWISYVALMSAFVVGLLRLRSGYEAEIAHWREATLPLTPQGAAFRDRIVRQYGNGPQEVAQALGVDLSPAAKWWPANPKHEVRLAVDPASGFEFELNFLEGELRGYRARPKTAPPPGVPLLAMERIRQLLWYFAWLAWLLPAGLALAPHLTPVWRNRAAHAALALALASLAASQLSIPAGSPLSTRFLGMFELCNWAVMLPLSVGLLLWSCRPTRAEAPRHSVAALEPDMENIQDDVESDEEPAGEAEPDRPNTGAPGDTPR